MKRRPRTESDLACLRLQDRKTAELRRDVHVVAQKEPDAKAAPAKPHQPYPAGAAVHSAAWLLLDLGLTDEEARRIEESF